MSMGSSRGFFGASVHLVESSYGFLGLLMVLWGFPVFLGSPH